MKSMNARRCSVVLLLACPACMTVPASVDSVSSAWLDPVDTASVFREWGFRPVEDWTIRFDSSSDGRVMTVHQSLSEQEGLWTARTGDRIDWRVEWLFRSGFEEVYVASYTAAGSPKREFEPPLLLATGIGEMGQLYETDYPGGTFSSGWVDYRDDGEWTLVWRISGISGFPLTGELDLDHGPAVLPGPGGQRWVRVDESLAR